MLSKRDMHYRVGKRSGILLMTKTGESFYLILHIHTDIFFSRNYILKLMSIVGRFWILSRRPDRKVAFYKHYFQSVNRKDRHLFYNNYPLLYSRGSEILGTN